MSDVNANIGVHIDTSQALTQLKNLQRQLATFHSSIAKGSAASTAAQKGLQNNLLNSINATGMFTARMGVVKTSTESFTHALEKNRLTMREYYRYAGASTKTFGRLFKSEFATINKVAEERVKKMQTQYIKMGRDASGAMKAMSITPTTLNMKDYATQTALAAQKQALFNQIVRQGSTNLLNFGKNTQWAGRQLMVGFSVPLMYIGAAAASTFMKLEAQAVRFKRVYGEMFTTTAETDKALRDIELLAQSFTKYGVKVEETMKMAADAAAMGKMGADLAAQVSNATRLAVLGSVEQEKALETTISLTNAFGIAADELTNKINFLNAVENQTVVNIEDLTTAIPKAGPVVKQLGGSVEDLAFFLTAMKEGGINASEGANALKSGLASMINPSAKASAMLADLGININAIVEGNAGNLKNTVLQFAMALDTLAPLQRSRAIEQLFGKFQFARISTLFQNITKEGSQANRVLGLTNATVEELAILSQREMKKVEDAVGTNFKESVENLKVAIAPIGKAFLEAVTPIIKFLGKLFDKFGGLDEGVRKFIVTASALVGIIGPVLLMTFGLVANGVANIIKLFLAMRTGIMKIGGNTTILAEQTQYLNAEQLEAATVAASLNQAHTQLTQRFQMETSAVNALRSAYIEATVAAAAFARANPGMMGPKGTPGVPPRRFADGTVFVPGQGTGDTVPSLLTPGEAVIPRDVAQNPQVQPLIEALVSGKIAKFGKGTTEVKRAFAHAVDHRTVSGSKVSERLRTLGFGKENLYTAVGFDIPAKMNSSLNNGNVPLAEYRSAIQHPEALRTMTSRLIATGMDPKQAHSVAKTIRNNFLKSTRGIPGTQPINDRFVYSRMGNARGGIMGALAKSKNPVVAGAVKNLLAPASSSPVGKSNIVMTGTRPISEILSAVRGTRTSQAVIKALENVRAVDPNINLPVKLDAKGNIVAFQRPEVEKGMLSKTQNLGVLSGDKFETGRLSRGGGRQVTVTGAASKAFDRLIKKKIENQERTVAVQKGERITDAKGRSTVVSGTNTPTKPAGVGTTTGRGVDTRLATIGKGYRITPKGMVLRGAETGIDTGIPVSKVSQQFRAEQNSLRRQIEKQEKRRLSQMRQEERQARIAEESRKKLIASQNAQIRTHNAQVETAQRAKTALTGFSNKASMGMGALSGLTMAAAFAGGSIGEMAQKAMPLVFGLQALSMVLPLMTSWAGLIGLAVAGFAASTLIVKNAASSTRKKMFELADQTGITAKGLQTMSEFTNKVTAAEQLAFRSKNLTNPYVVQQGKSSFGTSFADSDQGKEILKGLKTIITNPDNKGQGSEQAQEALFSQLQAAVASGAFTVDQARSAAIAFGKELNNIPLGLKVNAQLTAVLGVDGENLLNSDGTLEVKMVAKETAKAQALGDKAMSGNSGWNAGMGAMDKKLATASVIGTFATAGMLAGGIAAGSSAVTGVGAIIAPIVGVVTGLVAGTIASISMLKKSAQQLAAASSSAIASYVGAVTLQNQIASSLQLHYEKTIAAAEASGDIAKADEERAKYAAKSAKLEEQGLKTRQAAVDTFIKSRGNTEAALLQAAKDKTSRVYKGTAEEDYLAQANQIGKTVSGVEEFQINFAMSTGALPPSTVVALADVIGQDKNEWKTILKIDTRFGGTKAAEVANIVNAIGDKETGMNIAMKVRNAGNKEQADKLIKVYSAISQLAGEFDVKVLANYYYSNKDAFAALNKAIDIIDNNKGKLEIDVLTTFLDPEIMGAVDANFFKDLDQAERSVYLKTISQIMLMEDPVVMNSTEFKAWKAQTGKYGGAQYVAQEKTSGKKLTDAQWNSAYASTKAAQFVTENPALISALNNQGGPEGGDKKQRDTTLDSILNDLKRTRDARVNQEGGKPELMKWLGGKKDMTMFGGLDQQLTKGGANQEFVDWIGGLEKKIQKTYVTIGKNGKAILTPLGEAAKKAFNEKQMGLFSAKAVMATKAAVAQRDGFVRLKSAGVESADALEMLADAEFMVSLAAQKNPEEVKRMIAEWKNMKKEMDMTSVKTNPQEYFAQQMEAANQALDVQERQARRTYEPQIEATNKLIEANNKLIEEKQRQLEMDDKIGNRAIEKINGEIEKLNRDLSTGVDKTLATLSVESSKLSEHQAQMAHAVDAINEKYDLQEKALNKISEINQDIIAQQKQQTSLADALTQGDISAAAQAAQDMRASSAARASSLASDLMTAARDSEIAGVLSPEGLTQKQITERQYQIDRQNYTLGIQRASIEAQIAAKQEEIYQIDLKRKPIIAAITALEDQNYTYNNKTIPDLQAALDLELGAIEAKRKKWTDAQLALDLATVGTDKFKKDLSNADTALTNISGLWKDITDKNFTVTIKTIEEKIVNTYVANQKLNSDQAAYDKELAQVNSLRAASPWAYSSALSAFNTKYPKGRPMAKGGWVPNYKVAGGYAIGTDTVPTMLTPGEFVVNAAAAQRYGSLLSQLNSPTFGSLSSTSLSPSYSGSSAQSGTNMYNYSIGINVNESSASADDIAREVMVQIKSIDAQRIRTQR